MFSNFSSPPGVPIRRRHKFKENRKPRNAVFAFNSVFEIQITTINTDPLDTYNAVHAVVATAANRPVSGSPKSVLTAAVFGFRFFFCFFFVRKDTLVLEGGNSDAPEERSANTPDPLITVGEYCLRSRLISGPPGCGGSGVAGHEENVGPAFPVRRPSDRSVYTVSGRRRSDGRRVSARARNSEHGRSSVAFRSEARLRRIGTPLHRAIEA